MSTSRLLTSSWNPLAMPRLRWLFKPACTSGMESSLSWWRMYSWRGRWPALVALSRAWPGALNI